jgi:predicted GIY-YIG superfamily endonuclease
MSRVVYLIHLDQPLAHARHYIGFTDDLERRLHEHQQGNGAKMLAAVARAGISWRLARIKVGRNFYQATARGSAG